MLASLQGWRLGEGTELMGLEKDWLRVHQGLSRLGNSCLESLCLFPPGVGEGFVLGHWESLMMIFDLLKLKTNSSHLMS